MSKDIKVVDFKKSQVDHILIEILEDLLKSAKEGELQALIYVDSYFDGKSGSGWDGKPSKNSLAELSILHHKLINEFATKHYDEE